MKNFIKSTVISDPDRDQYFIDILVSEGVSFEKAKSIIEDEIKKNSENIYINDVYTVIIRNAEVSKDFPEMLWLSIKRNDKEPIHDWRDLQEIKNKLIGTENEAVEIYPAESRLVDSANQYHLWAFKDPSIKFPFGFKEKVISGGRDKNKFYSQRDFEQK